MSLMVILVTKLFCDQHHNVTNINLAPSFSVFWPLGGVHFLNVETLFLRVVQTRTILFLKSMSERSGSDLQRLWNWISWSPQNRLKMVSFRFIRKFRVVLCRIRLFPTMISRVKWIGSELPLKGRIDSQCCTAWLHWFNCA